MSRNDEHGRKQERVMPEPTRPDVQLHVKKAMRDYIMQKLRTAGSGLDFKGAVRLCKPFGKNYGADIDTHPGLFYAMLFEDLMALEREGLITIEWANDPKRPDKKIVVSMRLSKAGRDWFVLHDYVRD